MRLPRKDGLNIVPFIDIMLVLLAIILSTATFISQGHIKINTAESNATSNIKDEKKLAILLDENSVIYIDGAESNVESLKEKITALQSNVLVELTGDKDARFQTFIDILDILKEKGHEKFVIKAKSK